MCLVWYTTNHNIIDYNWHNTNIRFHPYLKRIWFLFCQDLWRLGLWVSIAVALKVILHLMARYMSINQGFIIWTSQDRKWLPQIHLIICWGVKLFLIEFEFQSFVTIWVVEYFLFVKVWAEFCVNLSYWVLVKFKFLSFFLHFYFFSFFSLTNWNLSFSQFEFIGFSQF